MMGLLDCCSWFGFFIILSTTSAQQEGFVSLECCSPSNNTDPYTKINWISDIDLFNNRGKCENAWVNDSSYKRARTFGNGLGNKWCYNLTTVKDQNYLIRGSFLHGLSFTSPDTFFDISLDATIIVTVNSSFDSSEVEAIFRATNDNISFCLVRRNGITYISSLELRPLSPDLVYSNLSSSADRVFKVVKRVDVGNNEEAIRYPYDPSDRIWDVSASSSPTGNATTNVNMDVKGAIATVPLPVLQTAVTDPMRLELLLDDLEDGDNNYLIYIYFLELNESVQIGQRMFDIYANGVVKFNNFDTMQVNNGTVSNYREIMLNVTASKILNVSLVKGSNTGVDSGPICNAYEILQVEKWVDGTLQEDVDAIVHLRDDLLAGNPKNEVLGGWVGDPCLPLPWTGLFCESVNGSTVISHVDLSFNDFQRSLPRGITELTHLKYLNLSHNSLRGTIPSFPLSSALITLDVSHNELTGPLPESLASLTYLTTLNFGCNSISEEDLPSNLLNRSNLTTDNGICVGQGSSHSSQQIIIGSVAGGFLFLAIAVGVIFVCFYRRRRKLYGEEHPSTKNAVFSIHSMDDIGFKSISIQAFTLECIEIATLKYKALIGEGGFGPVYRGTLPDGQEVAVKVRSATSSQGTREFENELNLLSAMRHDNLVPLLGYCCESDQQILVYPFMSNGSLQDRLYGEASKRKVLDWPTRLSIALGSARGLLYLHTFAGRCIIHRDVKSSNILLDHSMTAKVADFGFSKYAPQEGDSGVSLEVRGTAGYLDPEYYSTQHLSVKSDVFSFGVVLLEIISGREPLDIHRPRNEWSLVEWAKPLIRESKIDAIVDPCIKVGYHAEAMWRVVEVALACIEPFSAYRPCMVDIVRELEDALIIENNASEYMKSIDSFGGSNRFSSIEKKINLPVTPTPTEPSPIISQALAPPQPR